MCAGVQAGFSSNASSAGCQKCTPGHYSGDSSPTCLACASGLYSFTVGTSDGDCKRCPAGGFCPGEDRVFPAEGFWQAVPCSGRNSTRLACLKFETCHVDACLGGNANATVGALVPSADLPDEADWQCKSGYRGKLCQECVATHAKSKSGCLPCPTLGINVLFSILFALFVVAVITALTIMGLRNPPPPPPSSPRPRALSDSHHP